MDTISKIIPIPIAGPEDAFMRARLKDLGKEPYEKARGGRKMRRVFLLLLILLSVGVVNAFSLVYDNYRLIDVLPKGKIVGDRVYEDNVIRVEFDDLQVNIPNSP